MEDSDPPGWPLCALVTISRMECLQDFAKVLSRITCSLERGLPSFGSTSDILIVSVLMAGRFIGLEIFAETKISVC